VHAVKIPSCCVALFLEHRKDGGLEVDLRGSASPTHTSSVSVRLRALIGIPDFCFASLSRCGILYGDHWTLSGGA
jgi:hypothetical protein